eukprot:2921567-Rhodomonas_salina.1
MFLASWWKHRRGQQQQRREAGIVRQENGNLNCFDDVKPCPNDLGGTTSQDVCQGPHRPTTCFCDPLDHDDRSLRCKAQTERRFENQPKCNSQPSFGTRVAKQSRKCPRGLAVVVVVRLPAQTWNCGSRDSPQHGAARFLQHNPQWDTIVFTEVPGTRRGSSTSTSSSTKLLRKYNLTVTSHAQAASGPGITTPQSTWQADRPGFDTDSESLAREQPLGIRRVMIPQAVRSLGMHT